MFDSLRFIQCIPNHLKDRITTGISMGSNVKS